MNLLPNDSSIEGTSSLWGSGVCPQNILKIRTLEMPFSAIWALNYELQFDFKKRKNLGNCAIFLNLIFLHPPCTPVDQGQQGGAPLCTPLINPPLHSITFAGRRKILDIFASVKHAGFK
jgi:hypothetical protein